MREGVCVCLCVRARVWARVRVCLSLHNNVIFGQADAHTAMPTAHLILTTCATSGYGVNLHFSFFSASLYFPTLRPSLKQAME